MGCTESKIDNEEIVLRCRDRKEYIWRAVTARNKFAAAHSAHAMSLKNSGACLNEFADGEAVFTSSVVVPTSVPSAGPSPPPMPYETFIVPPPPLPAKYNASLQRASTMPEISFPKSGDKQSNTIIEEVSEDDDDSELVHSLKHRSRKNGGRAEISSSEVISGEVTRQHLMKNPPIENKEMWDFRFSMENGPIPTPPVAENKMPPLREEAPVSMKVVKRVTQGVPPQVKKNSGGSNLNLVQIFIDMDDCFLKASESAKEVSRMLEATRLHYHSNFADQKGHINHSKRVMRVITWNKSFRGLPNEDDAMDDFDMEEDETHATVLDKLLAWEKKLYDEVKAGEEMKFEYQKKVNQLNKLRQRGSKMEALERMKAAVSHLHTRFIVDMQYMDSTVSEINRLRDEQLYPKLVTLVDGMAKMWETMRMHHENQCKIVEVLRLLDESQSPKETSDHHFKQTRELGCVIQEWHHNISELMGQQREYIKSINSWLKLNLAPIDVNLQEKVSSPVRTQNPPIYKLLQAWNDYLEKIPDEPAKTAILNFAATIQAIWEYQKEEMDFRKRCAESRKDLVKKTRDFENWYTKYCQQRNPPDEMDSDWDDKNLFTRQQLIEVAKHKVESDEEVYQKHCLHVRQKSLTSLKSQLPLLFQALSSFSFACSEMYSKLRSIAHRQAEKR